MALNQKHVFWEALIIAIFIFGTGFVIGILIESSRSADIENLYLFSEANLLDVMAQSDLLANGKFDCDLATQENLKFGDRIYWDALQVEDYEESNKLTGNLSVLHKKYDVLRTLFWLNSIKIKEKCGGDFHIVVYVYVYDSEDLAELSKQKVFSNFLYELKEEYEDKIVLIPIAMNMGISSLDMLLSEYNVSGASVIFDEEFVYADVNSLEEIRGKLS